MVPIASRGSLRDQLLGDVHHFVPVAERLVELHHRELRIVTGRDALVAEDPPDLEHPLHPADDQPLQVQFERDPQVQVHVERVVMCDERPRVGAACIDVEHGGLDLDEAVAVQRAAEARDHRMADLEGATGLVVHDQVRVPLPEARVGVGETVPLAGHRAHRLREQLDRDGFHRELTLPGGHHGAGRADPVAEVELLHVGELIVARHGLRDEQLDLVATIADGGEHELARVALEHEPTGDGDLVLGLGTGFEFSP